MGSSALIRYLDLGFQYGEIEEQARVPIETLLKSGNYVLGQSVEAFEVSFSSFSGATHGIGVANGTDALRLTLQAVNLPAGSEVVVSAHTFKATVAAVISLGLKPVLVDIDPQTALSPSELLVKCMSPQTSAIIVVHMHGAPVCTCELSEELAGSSIHVIDDAAQAHGAIDHGRPIGWASIASCYSMYPGKNLGGVGDAGMVTTSDQAIAERISDLRNWVDRPDLSGRNTLGTNSRLDAIQAVVLNEKLKFLPDWNTARREQAAKYAHVLDGKVTLLKPVPGSVYHHLIVRVKHRDAVRSALQDRGVETGIHYAQPISESALAAYCSAPHGTQEADRLARETLSLPIGPHLTSNDVDRVCDELLRVVAST